MNHFLRATKRLGFRSSSRFTGLVVLLAAALAAGCGEEDRISGPPKEVFAVETTALEDVPNDASRTRVVRELGPPARIERRNVRIPRKDRPPEEVVEECYIYGAMGGTKDFDRVQLCFQKDRIVSRLSVVSQPGGTPGPGGGPPSIPNAPAPTPNAPDAGGG